MLVNMEYSDKCAYKTFAFSPFLPWAIILQTRTKLKGIVNCWKLQIVFKSQKKLVNDFPSNDRIPKEPASGVTYKLQCYLYGVTYKLTYKLQLQLLISFRLWWMCKTP